MSLLLSSELFLIFRNLLITLTVIALIIAPFLFVKYSDRKHAKYQADIHNLPHNTMILLSIWPPKRISRFHRIKYVGKSFGYGIALYTIGIVLALIKEYLKTGHWELQDYLVSTLPILVIILVFCFIDSIKSGLFQPLHAGIAYIGDPTSFDNRIQTLIYYDTKLNTFVADKIPARRIKHLQQSTIFDNCIDVVLVEGRKRFRIIDVYKPTQEEKNKQNAFFLCTKPNSFESNSTFERTQDCGEEKMRTSPQQTPKFERNE